MRNCNEGGQSLVRTSSCLHSELKRGKNSWSSDTRSSGWEAARGGKEDSSSQLALQSKTCNADAYFMTLEPLFGTSDKKSQISPNLQASSTRAWKTKRSKKRKHDCCFQWQAPHKPTPRERKKKTNIHTQTHTLTHPNPWPHRVREQEPKIKERVNNKWEIKTEENYLLYAQTEKEDCSSVSVSVYCSHNAQSEKQTGRKREQAEPVAFVGCWCPRRKRSCCCPRKRQESAQARQPASQPASVLLLLGERETKLRTREQGNTPNKQPTTSTGNNTTRTCDLEILELWFWLWLLFPMAMNLVEVCQRAFPRIQCICQAAGRVGYDPTRLLLVHTFLFFLTFLTKKDKGPTPWLGFIWDPFAHIGSKLWRRSSLHGASLY